MIKDIYINNEGDFNISINNDIELIENINVLKQEIYFALSEDIKYGLITIYNTNLSEFNGQVINNETIMEIQERINNAIVTLHPTLNVIFYDPIVSNDQKLFLTFDVTNNDKINFKYAVLFDSNKLYVNYVN